MNPPTSPSTTATTAPAVSKPGFFGRLLQKLDTAMKRKADAKAPTSSCCGGKSGKGGKCC